MQENPLFGKDIVSVRQLDIATLSAIERLGNGFAAGLSAGKRYDLLRGKVITALFYEPSSRTFASFITAAQRLGGGFIPLHGTESSSVAKGETFEDTVRTFAALSDLIVLRHPTEGASSKAAELCGVPIINAGDGGGEHPTQAILELMTIRRHVSDLSRATVTVIGDLLYGRTIHSLVYVLSLFPGLTVNLVSPGSLRMPPEVVSYARDHGVRVVEAESPQDLLPSSDVIYLNRIKKERFADLKEYEKLRDWYRITPKTMEGVRPAAILMHPLPRAEEIDTAVDTDPRAVYFGEQLAIMVQIRMAILALVLTERPWKTVEEA
jgi:aspartate carbamoyltransferase